MLILPRHRPAYRAIASPTSFLPEPPQHEQEKNRRACVSRRASSSTASHDRTRPPTCTERWQHASRTAGRSWSTVPVWRRSIPRTAVAHQPVAHQPGARDRVHVARRSEFWRRTAALVGVAEMLHSLTADPRAAAVMPPESPDTAVQQCPAPRDRLGRGGGWTWSTLSVRKNSN